MKVIRHCVLRGLDYLAEELRYDEEQNKDDNDLPWFAVVQCAACLINGQAGFRTQFDCLLDG